MHKVQHAPHGYSHRRYYVEAANGPHRWYVWRPGEEIALCGVCSLREAKDVITDDLAEARGGAPL
jgi:hypothetical protein